MAMYRARWKCPVTGMKLFRDFHSKKEADAFAARPRVIPVMILVQYLSEVRPL